jgi:hypothetical protein
LRRLRTSAHDKEEIQFMRTRRRIALLLVSAGALGVGLIAFPGSAAAAPPVVPSCAFPNTAGSDSCGTIRTSAINAPFGGTLEPGRLGVRVRSQFSPSTSETTSVKLQFDEQIALNLAGIPTCPAAKVVGKNIATAYNICGPAGSQADNAFLSPAGNVSGIGSTIPVTGGAVACTMIFKGADNNHLTIYARAPVPDATTGCNNPAANTGGTTTVVFTGTLSHQPVSSIYDLTLTVPNTQTANPALDDFYATVSRGSAFRGRCANRTPSAHRMLGTWDYTAVGDANDSHTSLNACPH